ncbi:chromate transporter [uncultured Anaerotruncus sp.]|uniref:chromate transporter n=1 Tax=uncultured Anaerotruncus sp. TaxID=905011 RepID=UPI00280A83C9|nr:chromate transporter [uncultured Anaerotruncus sp.]
MKKNHQLLNLFAAFFKIGLFTFGGGYAMIPLIHREAVENHRWISDEEMLDVLAISEATPGPVSINSATFIGCRVAGVAGSAAATLGVALPSFLIIAALSLFIMQYQRFTWLTWVFDGIRAGVVVLILNAVIKLGKQVPRTNFVAAVILVDFLAASFFNVSVILLLVLSGAAGVVRQLVIARRNPKAAGGDGK